MQVLTSLSGLPISAASASFAPTNSADVSAIASAYQVVSATGTQLNAGTAYLTSVNEAPISASRAGNAANASLANSAYYDGTGRLISALPDSAAVSSIASAYAESAASGKQDSLTFAYNADSAISSINGSALAGGEQVVSSTGTNTSGPITYIDKINDLTISAKVTYSARSALYASVDGYGRSISACITSVSANSAAWDAKLDSSAFNSADFYSTSNPSSFITGVDLSPYQTTAGMSGYMPTSLSSDFQQVTGMSSYALSADVSATVDLVGTQSANWGGSALEISAAPDFKLTKSGNVLVIGPDETVLWESSNPTANNYTISLSESIYNFRKLAIYGDGYRDGAAFVRNIRTLEVPSSASPMVASVYTIDEWNTGESFALCNGTDINLSGTSGYVGASWYFGMTTGATPSFVAMRRLNDRSDIRPYKIVGIGRKEG